MNVKQIVKTITQLEATTEELVFDIVKEADPKALHRSGLDILVGLAELKKLVAGDALAESFANKEDDELNEVNKVSRRLKRWASNQEQINSKILNEFLKMQRDGVNPITEDLLRLNYDNDAEFYKNYPQMKTISLKNHGKVFELMKTGRNEKIVIWEPVKSYVEEYGKEVGIL